MKNILHKELMKGIRGLAISQQYNLLGLINNFSEGISLPNRMLGLSPAVKDQAMKEIRLALVLGPDKIDF